MALCGYAGWFISVLAFFGIIYTLASKEWKKNNQAASIAAANSIHSYEGLWVRCVSSLPGQYQCDNFDESFLNLPAELQAQRAMMVLAAICAVAGVLCGGLGMDCVVAMGDNNAKPKIYTGRTGGGAMLLGGILTLAAVSWYAAGVVMEFNQQQLVNATFVYEFGTALYIGWISSILAIIAGILLLCCNCGATDEADDYPYNYGPAKPVSANRPNTEYV